MRAGFAATTAIGVVYSIFGVFAPTWNDLALGMCVTSAGIIGLGLGSWLERDRDD